MKLTATVYRPTATEAEDAYQEVTDALGLPDLKVLLTSITISETFEQRDGIGAVVATAHNFAYVFEGEL